MFPNTTQHGRRRGVLAVAVGALLAASPALAEGDTPPPRRPEVSGAKPTSPNATVNLVNALVKQGVLSEEQAAALIKQAEDEAYVARQSAKDANAKADEASKTAAAAAAAASPPGTKRVTYVPEVVKKQLREELRREVMDKAKAEGWASPGKFPEWASRIRFYGDLRARYEGVLYPDSNTVGPYDFNALNNKSSPVDVLSDPLPTYDATETRNRARLRARLGFDAQVSDEFTAGMRIATGDGSSPVSTNQTLGGSGGNFSKYAIWLDRAYLKWQPLDELSVVVGRFDNPFFTAGDMVWNKDLGFDGAAVKGSADLAETLAAFVNAGAFPIYNTSLNLGSGYDEDYKSHDKWMQGAQLGFSAALDQHISLTVAAAFYNFTGVRGRSALCDVDYPSTCGETDSYRPLFAQKGNTYMYLRENYASSGSLTENPQYFGLAGDYRPVVVSGKLDFSHFDPVHVIVDGEFVRNTAFDKAKMAAVAVNNFAPSITDASGNVIQQGGYDGGDTGWFGRVTIGHPEIRHLWDWSIHGGYKYVESDAVIDAFTDADFGLGGTNLKGYFLGGSLGLADNVWASARWLSANSIVDVPYAVDIFQVDLNARF